MFSSESFINLGFTFKPMIHFNLISVCSVRYGLLDFFFAYKYLVVLALFIEKTIFSLLNCLSTLVENQ